MEGGGQLSMDCEDMFKEITKKLYGEEAAAGVANVEFPGAEREYGDELRPEEQLTAWGLAALMQNGFPPPGILHANFTPRTDPAAEDRWSAADEPLAWAHSRVASYNPAQRLFKCAECECVGFLSRVAEHWLGTHSAARVFHCPLPHCGYASSWARCVRGHLARDHDHDPAAADQLLRDNPALDDVTRYLQRLKAKVDARRAPAPTPAPPPPDPSPDPAVKRYACNACPYATDRRDLFTRHENIHRDEKPFHCYLCQKQFNRADHVKKHFLRMHRDHPYDLNRIRRQGGKSAPPSAPAPQTTPTPHYYKPPQEQLEYRTAVIKSERSPLVKTEAVQKGAAAGSGAAPAGAGAMVARRKGERRYACCYCAWSGVDNWCLKRHLNTHLKPFACALCEYKAARAERLATHVTKVHNKKACSRCAFLGDDPLHLAAHMRDVHHIESRNIKVPTGVPPRAAYAVPVPVPPAAPPALHSYGERAEAAAGGAAGGVLRRGSRAQGAARLFGYLEASDGSGDECEPAPHVPAAFPAPAALATPQFARDKENAAPHHDHCLRY